MLAIFISIAVAIWFFRSALTVGESGIKWAAAGIAAVIIPNFLWGLVVTGVVAPNLINSDLERPAIILITLTALIPGLLITAFVVSQLHRSLLRVPTSNDASVIERSEIEELMETNCTACNHVIQFKEDQCGLGHKCPHCHARFLIPFKEDME